VRNDIPCRTRQFANVLSYIEDKLVTGSRHPSTEHFHREVVLVALKEWHWELCCCREKCGAITLLYL
jgi:hypothetical protein